MALLGCGDGVRQSRLLTHVLHAWPTASSRPRAKCKIFECCTGDLIQSSVCYDVSLPWVSLGDEPFSPEGWDGDRAVKAGVNAPQAPLEQGGEGSGIAPGSAMAGVFSAGGVLWTAPHIAGVTALEIPIALVPI